MLVAVLVAMIVQANFAPKKVEAPVPSTEILVAAKALSAGESLNAENTRWQVWPESGLFAGAILKSAETDLEKPSFYDAPLRRGVEAGEPISRQALIADVKGAGNFLAAELGPGMRAMSVAVKAATGVAGFIVPGDRVDVILAYAPRMTGEGRDLSSSIVARDATQTVLSNVRVLGVDQRSGKGPSGEEIKVAKTVTLEVTKEQAETLVLATQMGDISLALRRLGEKDDPNEAPTPLTTDMNTSEVMLKVNDALRKSKTISNTVRVYSGGAVQNVPVRSGHPDAAPQR